VSAFLHIISLTDILLVMEQFSLFFFTTKNQYKIQIIIDKFIYLLYFFTLLSISDLLHCPTKFDLFLGTLMWIAISNVVLLVKHEEFWQKLIITSQFWENWHKKSKKQFWRYLKCYITGSIFFYLISLIPYKGINYVSFLKIVI